MQIGIRLHDSAKAPLEERLKTVKAQGFSCAHIALSKLFDDKKYSATTALTPGYAMYLKKLFEGTRMLFKSCKSEPGKIKRNTAQI